ncbi:MAG TPA: cytochrome P450 [Acidimicrobiales bacterium]
MTITGAGSQDLGRVGGCPAFEFNNFLAGPVLSHIEGIDELRALHPIVRSTFGPKGFWVITESQLVREALQQPHIFSSSVVTPLEEDPPYKWIPEMLDPPEHTVWRQLLAPHFAPKVMEQMEHRVRSRCVEIIESFAGNGHCNFLTEFAWRYPTTIFMELMGLPLDGLDQFLAWEHDILHLTAEEDPDRSRAFHAMMAVQEYFAVLIEEKRADPGDDLLSAALDWQIDGQPIPQTDMLSWCLLMFMAGLDTVSIQLSYSFWYLAQHPEARRRLATEPDLVPSAVEEFLRCFAFVAPSRKVMEDTDFHGCPFGKGDMVLVPLSAATRDPGTFPEPADVQLDRSPNNHIAFGVGPHRCLGSHLARRELRIALEEWHTRIPDYNLTDGVDVTEHGGMYGIDVMELSW